MTTFGEQSLPFDSAFRALESKNRVPMRWQNSLFDRLLRDDIPGVCRLPTGLGKTSVIPIWLVALAHAGVRGEAEAARASLPRRLIYIVNRRTVVDQATDDAKRLLGRVYRSGLRDGLPWATDDAIARHGLCDEPELPDEHAPAMAVLRRALACLSGDDSAAPLAVSTLRGELADNGEWKTNPARAAIVIGTIDMIGSKLLFSGYGDGRYGRAHHAGLVGQDALIVHDEAHLSPAFSRLLWTVEREQRIGERVDGDRSRSIRVMELSATARVDAETERVKNEVLSHASRGGTLSNGVFPAPSEEAELFDDRIVRDRREAKKRLRFVEADGAGKKDKAFAAKIADEAHEHDPQRCRVLVYVRSPQTAKVVVEELTKRLGLAKASQAETEGRIRLLTGTIRGFERDMLAKSDVLTAFRSADDRQALDRTVYLVSTSAGEVGADWDADHLVCDLTTLDSMAQRFGRVNRLGGEERAAQITVVHQAITDDEPLARELLETAKVLRRLPSAADSSSPAKVSFDASPAALSELLTSEQAQAAFSPAPTILPATDILFDHWSLTSIAPKRDQDGKRRDLLGRPEVGPYLHGVAEWQPPETHVAWRAELAELDEAGATSDDLEEIFDAFPVRAAELLRDTAGRVLDELAAITERLRDDPDAREEERDPRIVLRKQNSVQWVSLSQLTPARNDKQGKAAATSLLAFATVVLPVEVGGLLRNGTLDGREPSPSDPTALDVAEAGRTSQRARQRVRINADASEAPLIGDGAGDGLTPRLRITLRDDESDAEESAPIALEYRVKKGEREPGRRIPLANHNAAVAREANRIAAAIGMSSEAIEAITLAGQLHDVGKARDVWQRYACNLPHRQDPGGPVAKSNRYAPWRCLGGYRHEFGSLLDACADSRIGALDDGEKDLVLHLIAAHHDWARPHFERRSFDPTCSLAANETPLVEAIQRFARLQQRFGRWGLAWLESLLRCADAAGSEAAAEPTSTIPASVETAGVRT